jgi:TRAP transporter TAXI family solute receptor
VFRLNRGQQLVLVLLFALVIAIGLYVILTSPLINASFTLSTGRETGVYYSFGQEYAERVATHRVEMEIVPGAGSIETLNRLVAGEVDMGFVQGGTTGAVDTTELESLGSMYYEPVWIFHRAGLGLRFLSDLSGLRVSIGEEGSGVFPLAMALLTENGIGENDATFVNLGSADAVDQLLAGDIDVAFFVISPQSERVYNLLADERVEVLSLERAAAYRSRFPYLTHLTLPQGSLDLVNNIPAQDVNLLATTATLVVRRDVPDDLVLLMLPYLVELHRQPGVLEQSEEFPNTRLLELPMNAAADRYYQQGPSFLSRYLPPVWASVTDRLIILAIPLLTLLYPFFRGVPPIYNFGIRYTIIVWYGRLKEIDTGIEQLTPAELAERLEKVDELESTIMERTNIPNAYLDELYGLIEHVGLVRERLKRYHVRRSAEEAA